MKAITTKYHGPTNTRGSRVSASDEDGNRVSLIWENALDSEANHDAAAKALCVKMDWTQNPLVRGHLKSGNVYVMSAPWELVEFTSLEKVKAKVAGDEKRRKFTEKHGATGGTLQSHA